MGFLLMTPLGAGIWLGIGRGATVGGIGSVLGSIAGDGTITLGLTGIGGGVIAGEEAGVIPHFLLSFVQEATLLVIREDLLAEVAIIR